MSAALATTHSIEIDFEDIEIEEDGLFFGSFWGTAELALNDPDDGDFYVKHIAIKGRRRQKAWRPYGYQYWSYEDAFVSLPRPASDDRTFKAHLFRKIEARLYEDENAKAAWASEWEDAA